MTSPISAKAIFSSVFRASRANALRSATFQTLHVGCIKGAWTRLPPTAQVNLARPRYPAKLRAIPFLHPSARALQLAQLNRATVRPHSRRQLLQRSRSTQAWPASCRKNALASPPRANLTFTRRRLAVGLLAACAASCWKHIFEGDAESRVVKPSRGFSPA